MSSVVVTDAGAFKEITVVATLITIVKIIQSIHKIAKSSILM